MGTTAAVAMIMAADLQEVVKDLLLSGLNEPIIRDLLGEWRLGARADDVGFTYVAVAPDEQTRKCERRLGDRSCIALSWACPRSPQTGTGARRMWKGLSWSRCDTPLRIAMARSGLVEIVLLSDR